MQIPKRKAGKYSRQQSDTHMTAAKRDELAAELDRLKTVSRPRAIAETKRLGELGDFSENAEYQLAKGRLRGMNARIDELERLISSAVVIEPQIGKRVAIGSTVQVEIKGARHAYTILGSAEADPSQGVISRSSPLGEALLGHQAGDCFSVRLGRDDVEITIASVG